MSRLLWCMIASLMLVCGGCDDDPPADGDGDGDVDGDADGDVDGDADGDEDTGPPEVIEDLPIEEEVALPGLSAPVEVVRDDRGMWHIYPQNLDDGFRAEGYLMAHDRMGQMEFFRRGARGRTAELAGSIIPSLADDDADARFAGHERNAQKIIETLPDEDIASLEAFGEGVSAYIAALQAGERQLPRSVAKVLPASVMEPWDLVDTVAIIRLETAALSFDGTNDLDRSMALQAWSEAFPADSTDPRLAARAAMYHDLFPFRPAVQTWVRPGFNNIDDDSGTRAFLPPLPAPERPDAAPLQQASMEQLQAARSYLGRIDQHFSRWFGDSHFRGSNSWAVHGTKTDSGSQILASDPHLSLTSPPLWWHFHVDTKRAGGNVNAAGLSLVGAPGVVLGFTDHVAWGSTVHGFDVTDVYLETITPGVDGGPDTVLFNGEQVPIETVVEVIRNDAGVEVEYEFELVPHHGLIIPETRTEESGISIRWTGNEPSNEMHAFLGLMRATSVDEARDALDSFEVGGQNFVIVSREDIFWTTQVRLPVRDERAMTYDPMTFTGHSPGFLLPGTGEYEWVDTLSDRYLPHEINPDSGYIATANGDAVGVTADGDPFNDEHFIGWDFANGYRIGRITEVLEELTERGNVTAEEMQILQNDSLSPLGRYFTPALLVELNRAAEEIDAPGTHADLEAAVAEIGDAQMSKIMEMADRLDGWDFGTPAAVEGEPTADEISESVAATIFNVMLGRLMNLAFQDEFDRIGTRTSFSIRTMHWALTEPELWLRSYDEDLGDTILWDDIDTDVVESRGDRVVRAFASTLEWLEANMGEEMDGWRWGELHTLRLDSAFVPSIGGDTISIPTPDDEQFPNGFPRHGDRYTVDVSNFSTFATDRFDYGSGPQQRLIVEMTPDGPIAQNALPGGQVLDPDSPHHADEMELWRHNETRPIYFEEDDVVAAAEVRWRMIPAE